MREEARREHEPGVVAALVGGERRGGRLRDTDCRTRAEEGIGVVGVGGSGNLRGGAALLERAEVGGGEVRDRERDKTAWKEEDKRRAETERRGEQLKEAWRRRHPEKEHEKDRPKKGKR